MTELPIIIQELNSNLTQAIFSCLSPVNHYFIAFDQLDLGFDPSDPDYKNRLIGLILAARDLTIAARQKGKKFAVVVFLRDDIYDYLQFEDKNKITENFSSLIEWDTPRTRNTLKELMEKRFRALLGDGGEEIQWEDVFDEQVEMPGHQRKYQHILDRTFLRPRDVIRFCNQILQHYKMRKESGETISTKFENVDVHNARVEYSDYFRANLMMRSTSMYRITRITSNFFAQSEHGILSEMSSSRNSKCAIRTMNRGRMSRSNIYSPFQ